MPLEVILKEFSLNGTQMAKVASQLRIFARV